jgi:hypothetical protein
MPRAAAGKGERRVAYLSVEEMKKLLDEPSLPGSPEEIEVLRAWTQSLVQRKGERYVRRARRRLCRDWRCMLERGLSHV